MESIIVKGLMRPLGSVNYIFVGCRRAPFQVSLVVDSRLGKTQKTNCELGRVAKNNPIVIAIYNVSALQRRRERGT